jgi:CheY-like chemotaxis protein
MDMNTSLKNIRVLVVEDDPDISDLLYTLLQERGAEVVLAQSVDAAIKAHREAPAHILISDIRLGTSDGYALIEAIRANNKEYRGFTPAIALTAFVSPGDRERAIAAGFNSYIPKPFDPATLTETVYSLIEMPADLSA